MGFWKTLWKGVKVSLAPFLALHRIADLERRVELLRREINAHEHDMDRAVEREHQWMAQYEELRSQIQRGHVIRFHGLEVTAAYDLSADALRLSVGNWRCVVPRDVIEDARSIRQVRISRRQLEITRAEADARRVMMDIGLLPQGADRATRRASRFTGPEPEDL